MKSVPVNIRSHLKNIIGKSLSKKYVVIESDDWGSIRMPSKQVYKNLQTTGINLERGDSARYNLTDTLASAEDLEALYNILRRHRDHQGNHPVFTAVSVMANPDFDKIKADKFSTYYYEPFTDTLKRYNRESALTLWKQGLQEKLFFPEFHAREHLNIAVWMRMLQKGDKDTLVGFDEGCWGFAAPTPFSISYQAAFDIETSGDLTIQEQSIISGLELFEFIHGYKSSFFVPPNGPFNNSLEKVTALKDIKYIGAAKLQLEPQGAGRFKKRYHWLGKKNKYSQVYLTRNAFFEPNAFGKDWVASCLEDIRYAFLWKKPAIISSHRTNYIGSLSEKNRKLGLESLDSLLKQILERWPDVEFITSTRLGNILKDLN